MRNHGRIQQDDKLALIISVFLIGVMFGAWAVSGVSP